MPEDANSLARGVSLGVPGPHGAAAETAGRAVCGEVGSEALAIPVVSDRARLRARVVNGLMVCLRG